MSCANGTCSSTLASSTAMGFAVHSAGASSYVAGHSSRGVALRVPVSKGQPAIPDTEHIDPRCVWGDEGPVNDQRS
jgi:hypothetical protein